MKKYLFLLIILTGFVVSDKALAMSATSSENGDPMAVTQGWGLTGYQTPRILSGAITRDKFGVSFTCPSYFGYMGCMDITHTKWYEDYQTASAKNLLIIYGKYAFTAFPYFSGWLNSVK